MPLKAGARVNTPPLEAIKQKTYEDTPSACSGKLHCLDQRINLPSERRCSINNKKIGNEFYITY
jgi:hypothetical protein